MRTLKLTYQQIELITQALGIAEKTYSKLTTEIIDRTIHIDGNTEKESQLEFAKHYSNKAIDFGDLNLAIIESELDV